MWIKDFTISELRYRDVEKEWRGYGSFTKYTKAELKKIKGELKKIIKKIKEG